MITPSLKSKRTFNPIRNIVDNLKPPVNHPKSYLNLALGDPTAHGNLHCPEVLVEAVQQALVQGKSNGYLPSVGSPVARAAIAANTSREGFSPFNEVRKKKSYSNNYSKNDKRSRCS